MNFDERLELVMRYLDGELEPSERERFEQMLEHDEELVRVYNLVRQTRAKLAFDQIPEPDASMLSRVESRLMQEAVKVQGSRLLPPWRRVTELLFSAEAAAAVVMLMVFVGALLLLSPTQSPKNQTLVKKALKSQPVLTLKKTRYLNSIFNGTPQPAKAVRLDDQGFAQLLKGVTQVQIEKRKDVKTVLTNPGEASYLALDDYHLIAVYPSSAVQFKLYPNGNCLLDLKKGGVFIADLPSQNKTALIATLAVRHDRFVVEPSGTQYVVRRLPNHYLMVATTRGSVLVKDVDSGKIVARVHSGEQIKIYLPQGSISRSPWTTDPLDEIRQEVAKKFHPKPQLQPEHEKSPNDGDEESSNESKRCNEPKPVKRSSPYPQEAKSQTQASATRGGYRNEPPAPLLERFYSKVRNYMAQNRWREAESMLKDFLERYSGKQTQEAYYLLGVCYEKQGLLKEAEIAFKTYLNAFEGGKRRQQVQKRLEAVRKRMSQ